MKFIKYIFHKLATPFVFAALLLSRFSTRAKARKLAKNPETYTLQERLKIVYKVFKKILFCWNVKVKTIEFEKLPAKQMLFVADHKHNFDFIEGFVALYESGYPFFIIPFAKDELSKVKMISNVLRLLDCIFIQRQNGRSIVECFNKEMAFMKQKRAIFVFPETTRVPGKQFEHEWKDATIKAAYLNMVSICALTIYGSDIKRYYKEHFGHTVYVKLTKVYNPQKFINIAQKNMMETIKADVSKDYFDLDKRFDNRPTKKEKSK